MPAILNEAHLHTKRLRFLCRLLELSQVGLFMFGSG